MSGIYRRDHKPLRLLLAAGEIERTAEYRIGVTFVDRIPQYCVWDPAHNDYLYTAAWVEKLLREFTHLQITKP